jgi:RimJ/RimL family protein N-acetyltransferase
MKIERTTDWQWVRAFLLERVESIGCGMTPAAVENYRAFLEDGRNWFVRCDAGEGPGLLIFLPVQDVRGAWEVHACADRSMWGWGWIAMVRATLKWFLAESGAWSVQTFVRRTDRRSQMLARVLGMRKRGKGTENALDGVQEVIWFEVRKEQL